MTALACHRIRDCIAGERVTDFDQAVDLDRWGARVNGVDAITEPFLARLWVVSGTLGRQPGWR